MKRDLIDRRKLLKAAAVLIVLLLSLCPLLFRTGRAAATQNGSGESNANSNNNANVNKSTSKKPVATKPTTKKSATGKSTSSTSSNAKTGKSFRNRHGIDMVWIPPGSFDMGSNNGQANEKPVHLVTIGQGFFMGKYEVTQAQWQVVMGSNPSKFKSDANLPVEQVSWNEAREFINKLNEMNDGYIYRLPTESEWEYACRAGTSSDYYAQDPDVIGWYEENSGKKTHPVGGKQPNAFGLYDMSGNVWEWCRDWVTISYDNVPVDGSAMLSGGEQKYRVVRGGAWYESATALRSSFRSGDAPDAKGDVMGFRLVAAVATK